MKSRQQISTFGMEIKMALIKKIWMRKNWLKGSIKQKLPYQMLYTAVINVRKRWS